jgi:hypothetical protein
MLYKRYERRRRSNCDEDGGKVNRLGAPKRGSGGRFTALSFLAMGACLLFIKVVNPEAQMRTPVLMVVSVGLACLIMSYAARRMK